LLYLLGNIADVFEDFNIEVEEVIDAGEKVLACVRVSGRGKGSGVNVDMRLVHVWTHVDQKAVRLDVYKDKAEALEAVGLSEQAMSHDNVEVASRVIEQVNAETPDLSMFAPDVVLDNSNAAFDGVTYRGHDGVREWLSWTRGMWKRQQVQPQEFIPV